MENTKRKEKWLCFLSFFLRLCQAKPLWLVLGMIVWSCWKRQKISAHENNFHFVYVRAFEFILFAADFYANSSDCRNGFTWHKRKKKHKKHNHNRIMKVWKTRNRKKKDRFVGLPRNKCFCLTSLARHSMMLTQKTRIEAQWEHPKAFENHI